MAQAALGESRTVRLDLRLISTFIAVLNRGARPSPRQWPWLAGFLFFLTLLGGCWYPNSGPLSPKVSKQSSPPAGEPTLISLVDVAQISGVDYSYPKQPRPMRTLEAFGFGCAAFDADNDGWQDVLVVAEEHPRLYRNRGDGKFENLTLASGLDAQKGTWAGCAIGDYDGDGRLDVLLTGYHVLSLYRNLGEFHFELVTHAAGLDPHDSELWSSSAGFMDLNGDQHLDLVIVNFVEFGPHVRQYCELKPGIPTGCLPRHYVPQKGEVWRNTGLGRFEPVPADSGMIETNGVGLVLAFSDINLDGQMDFYIGNDGAPSEMMLNRGGLKFENVGIISGLAHDGRGTTPASMGSDWGDYDRDGQLDLAVSNFQDSGFLVYHNLRDNQFFDSSTGTGLAAATKNRLGFGTKWVDLDNDGWSDLYFVNGHVYDNVGDAVGPHVHFRQPLSLFRNQGGEQFVDVTSQMGQDVQRPLVGRGSATADFNNDGRIDLLAIDMEGPVMLLQNRSETGNHWITLDLRSAAPNVFAYGAHLTAKAGKQIWVADVSPASSYLSSSDPRVHWGLGATTKLDELTIRWPNGKTQTLKDVSGDQILKITQP